MQSRQFRLGAFSLALAVAAYLIPVAMLAPTAWSQVRIPADALLDQTAINNTLEEGAKLEQERRWSEAMHHFQDAVKEYPGHPGLKYHLNLSRAHFHLGRRYSDSNYVSSMAKMTEREALDEYSEVLLKIQAHYVDEPTWREMAQHGALHIHVALDEEAFTSKMTPQSTLEARNRFRNEMYQLLNSRVIRSRHEANEVAAAIGRLAQLRLGVPSQNVIGEFTAGALSALDPYSSFLTGVQLDEVFSQIEGNFVGLGVELKPQDESLLILKAISSGPADLAGIRSGDRVVAVDGKLVTSIGPEAAADMLRGAQGTFVDLRVVSATGEARKLRVKRDRVEVPSVEDVKLVDPDYGVGYMMISSFGKTTSRDVDTALWKLHRQGMRSLILDLRGNPGGLLTASVELADKFLTEGVIVSTRGRSSREDFDYRAHAVGTWRVPIVVLIDGDSASASEIFAGAIADHRRGHVVGVRSYGKGSVQGIFPLNVSNGGVRLTTAKFYSPSGKAISNNGVNPDVVVRTVAKPADNGVVAIESKEDQILNAGLQVARRQLSQLP